MVVVLIVHVYVLRQIPIVLQKAPTTIYCTAHAEGLGNCNGHAHAHEHAQRARPRDYLLRWGCRRRSRGTITAASAAGRGSDTIQIMSTGTYAFNLLIKNPTGIKSPHETVCAWADIPDYTSCALGAPIDMPTIPQGG